MFRQHNRFANFSLAKSFSKFTMISFVKRHVNFFSFFESHEKYEKIVFESSNKSIVKNFHRRDTRIRLQKLFVSFDFKNIIRKTQKNFMNIFDDVIDDYNDLQKQINTMKFKINNEFVIKIDVIVFSMILSTSIKSNVNASINVAMIKFQNNVNSINFASKFVKSSQKIFAINVFVTHQNQIFFFAIQSFDQQIVRNIQYEFSSFRSFEKIRERRSFNADILHHNDEKSSFFFLIKIEIHFCTIICSKSTFTMKLLKIVSFVLVNVMTTLINKVVFALDMRFCHRINLTNFVI